ncbi:ABC transporter ATP-binding protein [Streptomyces sp. NPDC050149]|uniref:ABC transporter ATP-binding protein n=1 Tax=unclassified Streptomyces TaxID=2593676 RepID=UPI0037AB438C
MSGSLRVSATTAAGLAMGTSRSALAGSVLLTLVGSACPVAAAWLTKQIIDGLTDSEAGSAPAMPYAVGLAAVGVAVGVLPHLDRLLRNVFARAVARTAQDRLFRAVGAQPGLAWYEDPVRLDRLRQAQQCGQDVPVQLVECTLALLRALTMLGGFAVALVAISPWLTVLVVLGTVPQLVAEIRLAHAQARAAQRLTAVERREMFFAMLLGAEPAAKEIRLFGTGDLLRRRMLAARSAADRVRGRLDRRTLALNALPALVTSGVAAGGLLWAVTRVGSGDLTLGDLSVVLAAVAAVQSTLGTVVGSVAETRQHLLVFGAYTELLTAPPVLTTRTPSLPARPLRSAVEFRDVWFRYGPDLPWVLRGVTLRIEAGRTIGVVGANGAGKSTLVKLVCRFYDPQRGSVLWDGVDVRSIPPQELRSRLSVIFQDFMSYEMTAAENIALGDPAAATDRVAVEAAARRAGVHPSLAGLPRGYDTMLTRSFAADDATGDGNGDGDAQSGVVLSGGQWQRVALARSMLREDRDLFVLDEPTAALDPVAQAEVSALIRRHGRGRARLLVTHRLSEIRNADRIAVLADGVVAEYGSHEELLALGGHYATAFRTQAAGYQEAMG